MADKAEAKTPQRVHLTLEQQYHVLKWCEEYTGGSGFEPTRRMIVNHIQENYGLTISTGAVSNMKKRRAQTLERYHKANDHEKSKKKARKPGVQHLNDALSRWLDTQPAQTDEEIVKKAKEIGEQIMLPYSFTFGDAWLNDFKQRRERQAAAAPADASRKDPTNSPLQQKDLRGILQDMPARDVYVLARVPLLYQSLPSRAVMAQRAASKQAGKGCMTLAMFANGRGDDVFSFAVGRTPNPRSFGHSFSPRKHLDVPYFHDPRATLSPAVFNQVLSEFQQRILSHDRHVWLILSKGDVQGLPPGATRVSWGANVFEGFVMHGIHAIYVPETLKETGDLMAGLKEAVKAHFRHAHLQWLVQTASPAAGQGVADLRVTAKQALVWIRNAVQTIPAIVVRQLFRKGSFLGHALHRGYRSVEEKKQKDKYDHQYDNMIEETNQCLKDLGFATGDLTAASLLENVEEDAALAPPAASSVAELGDVRDQTEVELPVSEEVDSEDEVPTVDRQEARRMARELHMYILSNIDVYGKSVESEMSKIVTALYQTFDDGETAEVEDATLLGGEAI
mmetsp:Transcript_2785/g.11417  ORF Transcript_2785/g.11417 Transcript_2785/m.11417 type:complete len:564 (-) Transcript_2785:6-1697(-)|eukprot:scaffold1387_cov260-Pinguiococcus_pyrenoidosus.AAC.9